MAKRIFTRVSQPDLAVVNTTTGEIVSGVANIHCDSIDEFIMCFMSSIPQIVKLDGNTIRVLMWCWKFSSFNVNIPEANTITNDMAFKEKIRQQGCTLSDDVINRAIHVLCKENMLIKRCKGNYFLNPEYFFRGTLSNRAQLQCNITYNV